LLETIKVLKESLRVDKEKQSDCWRCKHGFKTYETKCKSPSGGIVKKEASIQILTSLIDPKTKETTRVGVRVEGDKKVRFSKKSNQVL
jgi:large subunit ribosomal protein L24